MQRRLGLWDSDKLDVYFTTVLDFETVFQKDVRGLPEPVYSLYN